MSEGAPARLRVAVVAAAPALRAGLSALLAADPGLHPVPLDDLTLAGDTPDAIVIDYSRGEPETAAGLAGALPTTPRRHARTMAFRAVAARRSFGDAPRGRTDTTSPAAIAAATK